MSALDISSWTRDSWRLGTSSLVAAPPVVPMGADQTVALRRDDEVSPNPRNTT